jgi:transketolase
MVLAADQGAFTLNKFKDNIPDQFINTGVAEQNLISVAAGLALSGFKVFAYGIIPFVTLRCYEQIKVDLCCMNLPVTIVGVGAGYAYGVDGPTHHAVHDMALMRIMPGMEVWNPSDHSMISALVPWSLQNPGPKYIRLDKGAFPDLYSEGGHDFSQGASVLRRGKDLTIIATGIMVHRALDVADDLNGLGIDVGVLDLYRAKPVNDELLREIISDSSCVATLEENSVVGGIGTIVSEVVAQGGLNVPVMCLGVEDEFRWELGGRDVLQARDGLDRTTAVNTLEKWARQNQ